MQEEAQNTKNEVIARLAEVKTTQELDDVRILYLGRNGKFTILIKKIKDLPSEKRLEAGKILNESKLIIENALAEKENKLKSNARKWFDPTIPGKKVETGSIHLITQAINEIAKVFEEIGFVRLRYPEVEWDYYAFEALNFDRWHPARDDWETFFIDHPEDPKKGPMLLTPHTSSGQIREMERTKPPIRMINIAKCFRRQSDARHSQMFHQFEGMVVDKDISIAHLKGTLDYFAKSYFGSERKTRIRPYNFVFTEPSFEVDISCGVCNGTGLLSAGTKCKLCKEGWLEIGGAGMIHPNVLASGKIDHKVYSGFAFGWGVERVLMMKSGIKIPDIRILYSTDLRFLKQF